MLFLLRLAFAATLCNAYVVSPPELAENTITKRSPVEVDGEVDALVERGALGLYGRKTDTDLAPAKVYDVDIPDLDYSEPFISASVSVVAGALSFSSLVTGCVGVGSANPIASYSCAASIASTGISFLSAAYHAYRGLRDIRATLRRNNISIGLRHVKRGIEGSELTMSHEEYMEWVMRKAGINGTHIGHHQRHGVDYTTPVYQFHNHGTDYHLTISADDNGGVRHTLSFASDSVLEKRQGYQGVTVNGGLDLDACQRKAGDQGDNPRSASNAYSYILKDFKCLVSRSDLLNSNYVQSDLMDKSGKTVLTMGMSTYRGSQADKVKQLAVCSNDQFYFSESCIN